MLDFAHIPFTADLHDPFRPHEVDQLPEADRIWATIKELASPVTETDVEQAVADAEEEGRKDGYEEGKKDTLEYLFTMISNLKLSLEEDENGEMLVLPELERTVLTEDWEHTTLDLIQAAAQRMIDSIEWE